MSTNRKIGRARSPSWTVFCAPPNRTDHAYHLAAFDALFRRGRLDRELSEEMAPISPCRKRNSASGHDPAAVREAARRKFGGVAQTQEAYRDRRGIPWLEIAARDMRYALRGLRRNPGFTAAAIISLALGIGANTAIFSLFHALMLRMLPVARPGELVSLYHTGGWGKGYPPTPCIWSLPNGAIFSPGFWRAPAWKKSGSRRPGGRPQFTQREFVSGNYFSVLGVAPALGRLFTDADNRVPQGHPLAMLSYDFWQNRFGADPSVLGRKLLVDEQPLTVIGVAAPGFRGVEVESRPEVWVPAMMNRAKIRIPAGGGSGSWRAAGRMYRPGRCKRRWTSSCSSTSPPYTPPAITRRSARRRWGSGSKCGRAASASPCCARSSASR